MDGVVIVDEGHTLTQQEIEDIWFDVFDGDIWLRDMKDWGCATIINDEKRHPYEDRITLIAESRWRPAGRSTVPSVLWDKGTPSVVGF